MTLPCDWCPRSALVQVVTYGPTGCRFSELVCAVHAKRAVRPQPPDAEHATAAAKGNADA